MCADGPFYIYLFDYRLTNECVLMGLFIHIFVCSTAAPRRGIRHNFSFRSAIYGDGGQVLEHNAPANVPIFRCSPSESGQLLCPYLVSSRVFSILSNFLTSVLLLGLQAQEGSQ